jgi:CBS domain-containing protein
MKVRELMTPDPIVAEVPGHRRDVLRLFVKHAVSGMPVVKAKTRQLAGVVTRNDLFRKPEEEQLALVMSSRPWTIGPDEDVSAAARLFHAKRIHGLPVVQGPELVGVLSPTDLLRATRTRGATVEHYISSRVVPVYQETPLPVVWQTMQLTGQEALPVMDDAARLVGIVADSDLFKLSGVEESIGKRDLGLNEDDEVEAHSIRDIAPLYYAKSVLDLPRRPVRDIMERKVVTAFQKSGAEEAALKMAKARVNQLPVIDTDDRLVGILTDLDLMRAWFE